MAVEIKGDMNKSLGITKTPVEEDLTDIPVC